MSVLDDLLLFGSIQKGSTSAIGDVYGQKAAAAKVRADAFTARSNAAARSAYDDSLATEFIEPWNDLTQWSASTSQVIANRHYANAGTGSNAGQNHSFVLKSGQNGRAAYPVRFRTGGGGGSLIVGLSSDAAGAVPAINGSSAIGVEFYQHEIYQWNGARSAALVTGLANNINYDGVVTVVVDPTWISFCFSVDTQDGVASPLEYRWRIARTSFATINNVYILNTDNRTAAFASADSIGPMSARKAISTASKGSVNPEAAGRQVHWTSTPSLSGTANVKIVTPAGYDNRIPTPAVVMFHGNGSNEHLFSDNAGQQPAYRALSDAGFILISASDSSSGSTWGAQKSLDAYLAAVEYARDRYNISSLILYCNSMGGIEGQLCLADGRIPGVAAAIFHSTTHDLQDCYTGSGGTAIDFSATINTAYGVASYAQIPAGHDPALMEPRVFRGLPMLILSADDDASVNPVKNGKALATKVTEWSPEVIAPAGITGGHAFSLTQSYTGNFNGASTYAGLIAAFAKKYS